MIPGSFDLSGIGILQHKDIMRGPRGRTGYFRVRKDFRLFIPGKNLIADLDFFDRAVAFASFYKQNRWRSRASLLQYSRLAVEQLRRNYRNRKHSARSDHFPWQQIFPVQRFSIGNSRPGNGTPEAGFCIEIFSLSSRSAQGGQTAPGAIFAASVF